MIEAPIANWAVPEPHDTGQLRSISWAELAARLSAARELRQELLSNSDAFGCAFTGFAHLREELLNENGTYVNPDILADGKALSAKRTYSAHDAIHGDREN